MENVTPKISKSHQKKDENREFWSLESEITRVRRQSNVWMLSRRHVIGPSKQADRQKFQGEIFILLFVLMCKVCYLLAQVLESWKKIVRLAHNLEKKWDGAAN